MEEINYAVFNSEGLCIALYNTKWHGEPGSPDCCIPIDAIELTAEDAAIFAAEPTEWVWSGERLPYVPSEADQLISTKEFKLAELAADRYKAETAGITVGNTEIRTDRESQAMLTGAMMTMREGFVSTIQWKAGIGLWVPLGIEEITMLASAVSSHVQQCFAREQELATMVTNATTTEDVMGIEWSL